MSFTILIIDDHAWMCRTLHRFFDIEFPEATVLQASDAETGIIMVEKELPDVVVMDLQLPGVNGLQATRLLKVIFPDLPVIILTNYAEGVHRQAAEAAGADGFATKNFIPTQLVPAIRRFIPPNPRTPIQSTLTQGK